MTNHTIPQPRSVSTDLDAQIKRLRAEKLAALDRLIASVEAGEPVTACYWSAIDENWGLGCRSYGGSLDAALSLKDALLPGWLVHIIQTHGDEWLVNAERKDVAKSIDSVFAHCPARALLLATLKAYRHTVAEGEA